VENRNRIRPSWHWHPRARSERVAAVWTLWKRPAALLRVASATNSSCRRANPRRYCLMDRDKPGPASTRVRVRRGASRASYDREAVLAVLDAGLVMHIGVITEDGPLVIPLAYGRTDEWLYLHGSTANGALRGAVDAELCATVTIVDGLVIGRSPLHNSMQYRSVVVRGRGRSVDDPEEQVRALRLISDRIVSTWSTGREPTEAEYRRTMVLAVPLAEASAKIRTGGPSDEPEDLGGPHWGGSVPIQSCWGDPVAAASLDASIVCPRSVSALAGRALGAP
jgi:nitroimidazol reductase NimA-like FMN-containing flavoprotein (pyridoxamine 5'-phosphate oxidase superfamily)